MDVRHNQFTGVCEAMLLGVVQLFSEMATFMRGADAIKLVCVDDWS
jgi:hypothetical protein